MSDLLMKRWAVGYKDRGLGHGDFAIITEDDILVIECPSQDVAEHIVDLHNRTLTTEGKE